MPSLSERQQDSIRRTVARYWSAWRTYQSFCPVNLDHEGHQHLEWQYFLNRVTPLLQNIVTTSGWVGLDFAWKELTRLQRHYGEQPDLNWWPSLLKEGGLRRRSVRWRPSGPPKQRPRAIKLMVAPEHRKPIAALIEQFRQSDPVTREYLVQRMFEIGGVAGVDYAAELLGTAPETLYEYYPLHISRAIRSGRSGRNAHHKGPVAKRSVVPKRQWTWANRMLGDDTRESTAADLGGKRDGHHAVRKVSATLRHRQTFQSF